jgi:hypothetical protein
MDALTRDGIGPPAVPRKTRGTEAGFHVAPRTATLRPAAARCGPADRGVIRRVKPGASVRTKVSTTRRLAVSINSVP